MNTVIEDWLDGTYLTDWNYPFMPRTGEHIHIADVGHYFVKQVLYLEIGQHNAEFAKIRVSKVG